MRRRKNPRVYSTDHLFYCTVCGSIGIPVCRIKTRPKEKGHLKKLYCLNCEKETNHAECISGTGYDSKTFLEEYLSGNFTENGERKKSLSEWKSKLRHIDNNLDEAEKRSL